MFDPDWLRQFLICSFAYALPVLVVGGLLGLDAGGGLLLIGVILASAVAVGWISALALAHSGRSGAKVGALMVLACTGSALVLDWLAGALLSPGFFFIFFLQLSALIVAVPLAALTGAIVGHFA
jgi:hypothetical protein